MSAKADREKYERHKKRAADRSREKSAEGREIGPLPAVADPERKDRGRLALLDFCREYFPRRFKLGFAEPHRVAAARMEHCTEGGGLFSCAMPRATGKTTLAECALMRAMLYGFRRFAVLVQATEPLAVQSLKKIQRELEANDLLLADFPEACYPIRMLERIVNRAKGQTLDGEPTRIEWTAEGLTLPTVPGAASSGAVLRVAGMAGAIRGLSVPGPEGEILRPDLVLIDDAQTRQSARSPIQTDERAAVIEDDVLGLAGPDSSIAAVMLCTVIYPNDLSDRFLSPEKQPEWQGVRTRMIEAWPERMDLWDEYAEIRRESFRTGNKGEEATAFYAASREEMDRGAKVSWPERFKRGELSGIQSAMNLFFKNPRGFMAEYNNDPEPPGGAASAKELQADAVAGRLSGLPRFEIPAEASRITAMIDVGGELHWYAVCAWNNSFGGSVVDYGTWPRQARSMFAADDPRPSLADLYPGLGESQRVYAGLRDLAAEILSRTYYREANGETMRVERCLIDAGWLSQTVYQFCRETPHAGIVYPSKGIARTASARGVSEWKARKGELAGWHWRATVSETGRGRMIQFDPDQWKTFIFERLTAAPGGKGYLSLYGRAAGAHALFAEHCTAEASQPASYRGTTFDKWSILPHRPDNHLWDCLIGSAVAAGVQGLTWSASEVEHRPVEPKPVKLSEIQARKRAERKAS